MKPVIYAFGYKKGSGKNTICRLISSIINCDSPHLSIKTISFADKLKDVAYQLFSQYGLRPGIYYENHRDKKEVILPELNMSPREIWIEVGNHMRDMRQGIWIDYALQEQHTKVILISDLRFTNEAERLKKREAKLVRLDADERLNEEGHIPGTDPAEIELDTWNHWDWCLDNNGTISALQSQAEMLADKIYASLQ